MLKKISSLNPRGHVNEHMSQGLYIIYDCRYYISLSFDML